MIQLFRSTGVDTTERVATTQMVYYLAIATAVFVSPVLGWIEYFLLMNAGLLFTFLGKSHPRHVPRNYANDGNGFNQCHRNDHIVLSIIVPIIY